MKKVHPRDLVKGQWYLYQHKEGQCLCKLWMMGDYFYNLVGLDGIHIPFMDLKTDRRIYLLPKEFQEFATLFHIPML